MSFQIAWPHRTDSCFRNSFGPVGLSGAMTRILDDDLIFGRDCQRQWSVSSCWTSSGRGDERISADGRRNHGSQYFVLPVLRATQAILGELNGNEGNFDGLVATASGLHFVQWLFTFLCKLSESAGIIESRSLGMKGTYLESPGFQMFLRN